MEHIGTAVIWLMMAFVALGAVGAIVDDTKGIGKEFKEGIHSIGPIFLPVAGIMASVPYLATFVEVITGRVFAAMGADPAMAAGALIAGDMGGYSLAEVTARSESAWVMAAATAFMSGATIVFSIPVGLAMLERRHHRYLALGVMSGVLTIPIGVFVTTAILKLTRTPLRDSLDTSADPTISFSLTWGEIFANLLPIIIFVVVLALCLRFATTFMIGAFLVFGRLLDAGLKLVLALVIIEYFTGGVSTLWAGWGFDPIIADSDDQFRALEIAGYIGIMLAGAFPMVYVIKTVLARPLEMVGGVVGISPAGMAGILAASANILAMYRLIPSMPARDRVLAIAFSVCAAFTFGDHLAFMANFQPTMVAPLVIGKLLAGVLAMILAVWLAVPTAERLARHHDDGEETDHEVTRTAQAAA
ncbi:MAG: ethanolamine utilization protein EutH [Brachybacterium sp.]|nr:ethanolamine utilization protein EutH [Brachybacterium sp.]